MITLDAAREIMLNALQVAGTETVPLAAVHQRVLAAPLIAALTQPPVAVSAMDGYAVCATDLQGPETRLPLAGESAAGHPFQGERPRGSCVRISTGAAFPGGTDQVVIQENTTLTDGWVVIRDSARPGAHVRAAGIDFRTGDTLLPAGTKMSGEAVALMAGAGISDARVFTKPRIGILSTGDELVEAGQSPAAGQIINSVANGLTALVQRWGGHPVYLGIARDTESSVREAFDSVNVLDMLVTIGGASVGDHDHLRRVFQSDGGKLAFEKIAVKPGKPTWFGQLRDTPVLGLPGNPVSALVMARLMLRPALAHLGGHATHTVFSKARLAQPLPSNGPRETFIRARLDASGTAAPLPSQDSSVLTALVHADCLIRREIHAPACVTDETVDVLPL